MGVSANLPLRLKAVENVLNGNTVDAGAACGSGGSVSLTSGSPNVVLNPSTITGTGTIALTDLLDAQTGTNNIAPMPRMLGTLQSVISLAQVSSPLCGL